MGLLKIQKTQNLPWGKYAVEEFLGVSQQCFNKWYLIEMLLEYQILQIRDNNVLLARCGIELLLARCHDLEFNVNRKLSIYFVSRV